MNISAKLFGLRQAVLVSVLFGLFSSFANAAPSVSSISGEVGHNNSVVINGSSFSNKAQAAPVAWDNLEDGSCNTSATVGNWSRVNDLSISTSNQRHGNSQYNAGHNFTSESWANFTGGSDAPKWFVQYWFYLDNDFSFSSSMENNLGNIKIFRMWSTGSGSNNLRLQLLSRYTSDLVVESADQGHGGYGVGWTPVTATHDTISEAFGHNRPGEILPGDLGWREYANDITKGAWHLFQFQYGESSRDAYNGTLKWWIDGKLVVDVDDVRTRTSSQPSSMRPLVVGWYNSHGTSADGSDHFYLDDAYIDNTWARVEIGDRSTYSQCTLREIQNPLTWSDSSVSIQVNQGQFEPGQIAFIFVVDEDGTPSPGYRITFGESGGGGVADLPPGVTIVSPTSSNTYAASSSLVDLAGSASDDQGISSVAWSNNRGGSGGAINQSGDWTSWSIADIDLLEGDNVITLTVTDSGGQTTTDILTVNYTVNQPLSPVVDNAWDATVQLNNANWLSSSVTYCVRLLVEGGSITDSGSLVQLSFKGRTSGNYTIRKVSIAERDTAGAVGDVVDSTWTRVTFDGQTAATWGASAVTVSENQEKFSNSIPFNLQAGTDYYVTFKIDTPSVYLDPPSSYRELYFSTADHTDDIDWSGNGHSLTQDFHAFSSIVVSGVALNKPQIVDITIQQ